MIKKIYIAGPLFNKHEQMYLEDIAKELEGNGYDCFLPHRDQPPEVKNLIDDTKLSIMIKKTGIIKINSNEKKTSILLSTNVSKSVFNNILTLVTNQPNIYSINKENKLIINLDKPNTSERRDIIIKLVNEIT